MATTVLNPADIFDFEVLPYANWYMPPSAVDTIPGDFSRYSHPKAGSIKIKNTVFPHMHVMDMRWDTADDVELQDGNATDAIRINFKLDGYLHTRFKGLKHPLDMRPQTHNLVYVPEGGDLNSVKGNQFLSMLHISLDKEFFTSAIGQDDAWSERILNELYHQRPFSGVPTPLTITPQMLHLIEDVRTCKAMGPMRNLLIQSRVLELLAVQIDQFKTPLAVDEAIRPDEVEKLNLLKAYLEANFLKDLSLAQLSRYCLLNEFKVKKGFKQLFHTTVFNYLRKLRMDYAGQLLRNSALSIDEVADKLGYEYAQHFSIAFKKYTGLTPSQYQHGKQRSGMSTSSPVLA